MGTLAASRGYFLAWSCSRKNFTLEKASVAKVTCFLYGGVTYLLEKCRGGLGLGEEEKAAVRQFLPSWQVLARPLWI